MSTEREDTAVPPPKEEVTNEETTETTQPEEKKDESTEDPNTAATTEDEKPTTTEEEEKKPEDTTDAADAEKPAEEEEEKADEEPAAEPTDPLDDPEATTAREQELQDRITKLREQIEERKKRHEECLEEKASKEEHLAEINSNIESTEERLEVTTMNVKHLRGLEDRSRVVAGKLDRCENFLGRVIAWVEGDYTDETNASKKAYRRRMEVDVLTRIQELQNKRAAKIKELSTSSGKIKDNKNHLRQQHQREPRKVNKGFEEVLTPQAKAYERCSSPRKAATSEDKDTEQLKEVVAQSEEELNFLIGSLKETQRKRSQLAIDINTHKTGSKKTTRELSSAIRQKELSTNHDQRKCTELETKNAAMISTLEVQIKAIKLLHYGAAGGPTTMRISNKQ